jgi:Ni/Fe-hydrogenase subunit HybB-like protein
MIGFVLIPCFLFSVGVRDRNVRLIRWSAVVTVFGIILNRLNVVLVCFNWQLPLEQRYFPSWMEIGISTFIITVGLVLFRFIVTRMPVFFEHPAYKEAHQTGASQ